MSGVLDDLRVLEIGDASGEYAGRLLAGFGADVVKIEPLNGAPSRRIGPYYHDEPHPDRSLHFWHYNVGKRAAAVDLTCPEGRALFHRLLQHFDVVIAAGAPADLEAIELIDGTALRCKNPRLIVVTITPFGLDGPWRNHPATDLTLMALGGSMAVCGYGPDDPPLTCAGWQAYQTACVYAVHGVMGAVLARDLTGRGQDVEVSIHEAAVSITEWHIPQYVFTGLVSPRAVLGLQFPARDGIIVSTIVADFIGSDVIGRVCDLLAPDGLDGPLRDPAARADRRRFHAAVAAALERYCALHTADEIYRAGQAAGFPWAPCRTPDENLDDAHLHDRGFWVPVYHPELGRQFLYAGAPFSAPACPWRVVRRPPLLGEHTAEVLAEAGVDGVELQRLRAAGALTSSEGVAIR
jgi:crotonobetainyl-CoA:carnitine CoA-transferase CaiB-like acyl-CoA transferase